MALTTSSRLAPAKKVFFPEVITTPLILSFSASSRSTVGRSEAMKTSFIVFTGAVGSSIVRVTIPASSISQPNMLMSVMCDAFLVRLGSQSRSMMVATPMPPPMHRVIRP